jgi:hypothetical protein
MEIGYQRKKGTLSRIRVIALMFCCKGLLNELCGAGYSLKIDTFTQLLKKFLVTEPKGSLWGSQITAIRSCP